MPKSSKEQIDSDEKKVIEVLQRNAKESIDALAKKCGFSRQKVWRIIKRLEKNKTIWGYHAVVDDNKLNRKIYYVLVKRTNVPVEPEKINVVLRRDLKKKLVDLGMDVECSFYVHGSYDWLLCITASHIRQVKQFTESFNELFKDYVADLQVLEVIFPIEKAGIENPNVDDFKAFF